MDNAEKGASQSKPKMNFMPLAIIIAGVIIAGAIVYAGYTNFFGATSAKNAAAKGINFINTTLLGGKETVALKTISEESGVYKITFDYQGKETISYITKNAQLFFPGGFNLVSPSTTPTPDQTTVGEFFVKANTDVCIENNKPIIYFFGSTTCPHCIWEKPVIEGVVKKFGAEISWHENIDNQTDSAIFSKYSDGGIPTIVVGCKYYRVGSGENVGTDVEAKNLTALFCKITGNKPAAVCATVTDIISQIK